MHTDVVYGTCGGPTPLPSPLSFVDLRLSAMDMITHWRRCSLTADFLAGFVAPAFEEEDTTRMELSMVIDELIENAVKFCADVKEPVVVAVHNYGDTIRLEASNTCDRDRAEDLEKMIRKVLESDLEALFLQQIEETAAADQRASRLGFITLCINHGALLGARITAGPRHGLYQVTVQVLLERREAVAS